MVTTQIKASQGRELESNPGFVLRADAAQAWDRAVAAFGKDVLLTGAWRSYETQERIFRERYVSGGHSPVGDYRTWPLYLGGDGRVWGRKAGTAAAAVPGTSNHGGGIAVDVKTSRQKGDPPYSEAVVFTSWGDEDRARFLRVAKEHGWDDDEGRSVGELWHLTYYADRDQHRGEAPKPAGPPVTKRRPRTPPVLELGAHTTKDGWVGIAQAVAGATVDGDYGPGTRRDVKSWQKDNGLVDDGIFGPASWARALRGVPYSRGDSGARVRLVQIISGASNDGRYGGGTALAVKKIQRYLGVKATGVFDAATRDALVKYWAK
jgi:D-alanyl-D-alanine carboxypeptidase-like protein/putative peptidoglycan binding protein